MKRFSQINAGVVGVGFIGVAHVEALRRIGVNVVGDPIDLKYRSADADTGRIMEAIMELLPPEAHEHREPTPEELARTYPPGYDGDPEAEKERRPGTDTKKG